MLDWLFGWVDGFWKAIKAWFTFFNDSFISFFQSFFLTLWDIAEDFFSFVLEKIFQLILFVISSLDFDFSFFNQCGNGLTSEILNVLGLIGLHEAIGIIVSAIVIRILLQLIPFTRLGS
jgi:hypothetical protein